MNEVSTKSIPAAMLPRGDRSLTSSKPVHHSRQNTDRRFAS